MYACVLCVLNRVYERVVKLSEKLGMEVGSDPRTYVKCPLFMYSMYKCSITYGVNSYGNGMTCYTTFCASLLHVDPLTLEATLLPWVAKHALQCELKSLFSNPCQRGGVVVIGYMVYDLRSYSDCLTWRRHMVYDVGYISFIHAHI